MNKKIKIGIIILFSTLFGFSLSCLLSISASKFYAKNIKMLLFVEHEAMGVSSIKNGAINDALFHFRNTDYLMDENFQNLFNKTIKEWTFFYPVKGTIGGYVFNIIDTEYGFPYLSGSTIALYGYVLDEKGDLEAAEQKYKEAAKILGLENIDEVKKMVKLILAEEPLINSSINESSHKN